MALKPFVALVLCWALAQTEPLPDHQQQHYAVRNIQNSSQPLIKPTCENELGQCLTSTFLYAEIPETGDPFAKVSSSNYIESPTSRVTVSSASGTSPASVTQSPWVNTISLPSTSNSEGVPWADPTTISADDAVTATLTTTIERTKIILHPSEVPAFWDSLTSGLDSVPLSTILSASDVPSLSAVPAFEYSSTLGLGTPSLLGPPSLSAVPSFRNSTTSELVIIPLIGPPVVCFGCYFKFPPNIAIKVPEFCIQLFGIKIGNCPPDKKGDNDNGGNDDEDDDDDDDDEDDDDEKSSKTETTTSISSTSSCTVTVTATQQTVFCSITRSVDSATPARTAASTTCLTSAYTTVTGCSVLKAITTVTTIQSSVPTPNHPLCDWHCDSKECPAPKSKRSGVSMSQMSEVGKADKLELADRGIKVPRPVYTADLAESRVSRRGQPRLGEWVDPSDFGNDYYTFCVQMFEYMRQQHHLGPQTPADLYHNTKLVLNGPAFEDADESMVTVRSNWLVFENMVQTMGIDSVLGCTVVLVVSRRGAWMGRFFEQALDDDAYIEMALNRWRSGPAEPGPMSSFFQYGIDDLMNHPERGKLGLLFGNGNEMTAEEDPIRALIVTPRERGFVTDPNGEIVEHPDTHSYYAQEGNLLYPESVGFIKDELRRAIPRISTTVVDYPPQLLTFDEMRMRASHDISDDYWQGLLRERTHYTPRGKIMIQYQPAKTCNDKASMRWWVDSMPVDANPYPGSKVMDEWDPDPDQIFGGSGRGGLGRRQECPVRSRPISSGPSPTISEPPPSSNSAGQGTPGKPTSPGASEGGTQPLPTGSAFLNVTGAPIPWNNSMTTIPSGSGGTWTWLVPTSLASLNGSTTGTIRIDFTRTTLSGNSTARLPPTTSWLNGTAVPVPGANSTVLGSNVATLNEATTKTSTALNGTKIETSSTGTSISGTSTSQSISNKTPSIHTTIYVDPPTWSIISSSPTLSSTSSLRRVIVTASVQVSVVKTITVLPTDTVRPRESQASQPPPPPPPPPPSPEPKPEPKPDPKPELTEAILVMLENVLAGGKGGVVFTEMWVMLPVKVGTAVDHCDVSNIGYKITDSSSSDRKWPPSISAKRGSDAFGFKNCKYEASTAGFGSLSCDGTSKMNCVKDPEYDKASKCFEGWEVKTYTSRMRCMLRKER
ncbi:hypothetical protein LZ32DRAFT_665299 [Colletotrichum eremochloae]|nr:hypothetical protein LZ32DRAFT_665299 [Colletotrichum eremochloae]